MKFSAHLTNCTLAILSTHHTLLHLSFGIPRANVTSNSIPMMAALVHIGHGYWMSPHKRKKDQKSTRSARTTFQTMQMTPLDRIFTAVATITCHTAYKDILDSLVRRLNCLRTTFGTTWLYSTLCQVTGLGLSETAWLPSGRMQSECWTIRI